MSSNYSDAVEITAEQAWFLAEHLQAGAFPWKLAITAPYYDPADADQFNSRMRDELSTPAPGSRTAIMDEHARVHPAVAAAVRAVCRAEQWLEWLTILDSERIGRGVLARGANRHDAVVALRYAQMITLTPMQVDYTEALVPILTAGLPDSQPANFNEFTLSMDAGVALDKKAAKGADVVALLTEMDVPESDAQIMDMVLQGDRQYVEITAHEGINGSRHQTDVSVNIYTTAVGSILVSPPAGEPRAGGESVFAPADPFAIAVALRDLTARLPSGVWFPDDTFAT